MIGSDLEGADLESRSQRLTATYDAAFGTCAWTLRSDSTTSPSKATSRQSGQQAGRSCDPRYRRDATRASPAAVRSGTHGGHWKITLKDAPPNCKNI